jgi:formaldehyde-activating enzyme involved in methanogenesis
MCTGTFGLAGFVVDALLLGVEEDDGDAEVIAVCVFVTVDAGEPAVLVEQAVRTRARALSAAIGNAPRRSRRAGISGSTPLRYGTAGGSKPRFRCPQFHAAAD